MERDIVTLQKRLHRLVKVTVAREKHQLGPFSGDSGTEPCESETNIDTLCEINSSSKSGIAGWTSGSPPYFFGQNSFFLDSQ